MYIWIIQLREPIIYKPGFSGNSTNQDFRKIALEHHRCEHGQKTKWKIMESLNIWPWRHILRLIHWLAYRLIFVIVSKILANKRQSYIHKRWRRPAHSHDNQRPNSGSRSPQCKKSRTSLPLHNYQHIYFKIVPKPSKTYFFYIIFVS